MPKTHLIVIIFVAIFPDTLLASKLYWGAGDWGTANYIKSCNLDGSDINTVIQLSTGFYGAMDVDVDKTNSKLYWVSAWGIIERCNLNGTGYQSVAQIANAWSENIFVNELNSKIYFTNTNVTDAICRIDPNGSNYTLLINEYSLCFDIDPVAGKIYYVTLYEYNPPYSNQAGRINKANLDGSGSSIIFQYTSNDWPDQVALDLTHQKIYWVSIGGKFQRANLDGSSPELLTTLSNTYCSGLAVDGTGGKIYWIDSNSKKIRRANLNGTSVEDIVTSLSDDPHGLDILVEYCGDSLHPYPVGDLNKDCVVDFHDFTLMGDNWLEDNRP